MADFTIKQNDTRPTLIMNLTNADGSPTNIATPTVTLHIKNEANAIVIDGLTMTKDDEPGGIASWVPTLALTATPGYYWAEAKLDYGGGVEHKWPNSKRGFIIEVIAEVG